MKKILSKYIIILTTLSLWSIAFLLPEPLLAKTSGTQAGLRVSPIIIPLTLLPNGRLTQEITVENLSNNPLPLRASFTDFNPGEEDGGYNFPDAKPNPLLSWTSVSPQELIIPAHSKRIVTLTVNLPREIPIGGYFGMLFFESVPENKQQAASRIVQRIGVLLLGNIGSPTETNLLQIKTFTLPLVSDATSLPFLLRLRNTGLEYVTAKPYFSIGELGGKNAKVFAEEKVIFPGKIRRWQDSVDLPNKSFGLYRITLSVSTGNGQIVKEEKLVIQAPYKQLGGGLLLLILLIVGISRRDKISQALRILLKG